MITKQVPREPSIRACIVNLVYPKETQYHGSANGMLNRCFISSLRNGDSDVLGSLAVKGRDYAVQA